MTGEDRIIGMLSAMQQDIGEIKTELAEQREILEQHSKDIAELKSDVATLKTGVAELKENVSNLNTAVGMIVDWTEDVAVAVKIPFAKPKAPSA